MNLLQLVTKSVTVPDIILSKSAWASSTDIDSGIMKLNFAFNVLSIESTLVPNISGNNYGDPPLSISPLPFPPSDALTFSSNSAILSAKVMTIIVASVYL